MGKHRKHFPYGKARIHRVQLVRTSTRRWWVFDHSPWCTLDTRGAWCTSYEQAIEELDRHIQQHRERAKEN